MEKQTVNINGKEYALHPFFAGQMRRMVRPIIEEARALQKEAQELNERAAGVPTPEMLEAMTEMTTRSQDLMFRQGEAALAGLKNTYPNLTLEELEDHLTPLQMANLFNRLVSVTVDGSAEPGEAVPQTKKRSR